MMKPSDFNSAIYFDNIPFPDAPSEKFKFRNVKYCKGGNSSKEIKLKTGYSPTKGDKLYFLPGCKVPRHKVRDWGEDKDISVTIKRKNATAIFGVVGSIAECVNRVTVFLVKKDTFLEWMRLNYSAHKQYAEIRALVSDSNVQVIMFNNKYAGYLGKEVTGYGGYNEHESYAVSLDYLIQKEAPIFSQSYAYFNIISGNTWDDFVYLASDNTDIYEDASLIRAISSEATVIDEGIYQSLRNMFSSSLHADNLTALEILSSCDFTKSLHYILLILNEFGNSKIFRMPERNHINFKSLLKFLNLPCWYNISDDQMVDCLIEKDQLTYEIIKDLSTGMKALWKKKYDTKHFKISTITVSDEVKQALQKA